MRALRSFAVLFLCGCQSGVSIDIDGGLSFPCTPSSATVRTKEQCPGNLFCGFDGKCHPPDVGGAYACREDFHCGGNFRCGPKQICVDPSADALRADAPTVTFTVDRIVASTRTPWDAGLTAVAAGRTFYQPFGNGPLTDVTPIAVADGPDVYTVARSQAGFARSQPPQQFFVGRAPLRGGRPVTDVAVARDQVFATTGERLFHYQWSPTGAPGTIALLDAGVEVAAIGDRLRSGNSPFPLVFEFKPDSGHYRVFDTAVPDDVGVENDASGSSITDMADTDGQFVYAIVDGRIEIANRLPQSRGNMVFGTFEIHSPGRLTFITNCSGSAASVGENLIARRLHVTDNPNVNLTEQPLVAVSVDFQRGDAGAPYWMRIEPNFNVGTCGGSRYRHVARGFCPACDEGEQLVDMQWGVDSNGASALRSECSRAPDGPPSFYDLTTDSAGFSCIRKRRADVTPVPITRRGASNPYVSAVASRETVLTRTNGLSDYTPVTLDRPPLFAHSYSTMMGSRLVAFGQRSIYRETPNLGVALHELAEGDAPAPAWVSRSWLLYDDGRVGLLSNLERAAQDAEIIAVPTRRDLRGPIVGTIVQASMRSFLVMTAYDTLLAGDLSNASVARPAAIEPKLVPEPGIRILSVALLDAPSDATELAEGFLLTENRVFLLTAQSEQRWTVSQIDVPEGQWLEVWTDRDRGRLGRRDGTVYSLPSGVAIAEPIEGDRTVLDFQAHCGRAYALTADGLWRLDAAADSPIGKWQRETVLPARANWQKMYGAATGDLWVFSADGTSALLKGAPCTQ